MCVVLPIQPERRLEPHLIGQERVHDLHEPARAREPGQPQLRAAAAVRAGVGHLRVAAAVHCEGAACHDACGVNDLDGPAARVTLRMAERAGPVDEVRRIPAQNHVDRAAGGIIDRFPQPAARRAVCIGDGARRRVPVGCMRCAGCVQHKAQRRIERDARLDGLGAPADALARRIQHCTLHGIVIDEVGRTRRVEREHGVPACARAGVHDDLLPERAVEPGIVQVVAAIGPMRPARRIERQAARAHVLEPLGSVDAAHLPGRSRNTGRAR